MESCFIFIGNRFFVLEEMLKQNINIKQIYAIENSYLEKELIKNGIKYITIRNKGQLIGEINSTDFEILLANGCPYILPISKLKKDNKRFINIHPSFLPELRGADPQPGSLLFAKNSGATCHVMDDGIDTGEIISQVKIPYSKDLDAALLYQLTFMAEKEVFLKAYESQFLISQAQEANGNEIYYSKKDSDLKIDFTNNIDEVYQKIKAFSNSSQGAYFTFKGNKYKVYDCEIIENEYLISKLGNYKNTEVVFNYEEKLVIKIKSNYLKLKMFDNSIRHINVGSMLK